jgi:hypothetical protein
MARPRSRFPVAGADFPMTVPLDGEVAQQVLSLAQQQGSTVATVLRDLVTRGLEAQGARLNHSVLAQREALREVRAQVLSEVRGSVARAMNETFAGPGKGSGKRRK